MISSIHRIVEDEGDLLVVFVDAGLDRDREYGVRGIDAGHSESVLQNFHGVMFVEYTANGSYVAEAGNCCKPAKIHMVV